MRSKKAGVSGEREVLEGVLIANMNEGYASAKDVGSVRVRVAELPPHALQSEMEARHRM